MQIKVISNWSWLAYKAARSGLYDCAGAYILALALSGIYPGKAGIAEIIKAFAARTATAAYRSEN